MQPSTTLTYVFSESNPGPWATLLGGGIGISIPEGITLKILLCEQLKIPADYLENRIQTILVNSRAVDDVEQVYLADGDVIALSAAMPGLAGATLRRGGHLAPMRAAISQRGAAPTGDKQQPGIVVLKLFNLVAKEIGPQILSGRIWLKARDLQYLHDQGIICDKPPAGAAADQWFNLKPAAAS